MINIIVIGTGNLGTQLCNALEKASSKPDATVRLLGYYNRSQTLIPKNKSRLFSKMDHLPSCDMIIVCTPDDAVSKVSEQLPSSDTIIVHTSGSVHLDILNKHKNRGVLYMPQTFNKERTVHFETLTICLESSSTAVYESLEIVGSSLSRKRTPLPSTQRKYLHLAAVFTNNFVNHCYLKAAEVLEKQDLPANLLHPLMKETLEKALELGAQASQTGPAKRKDAYTIAAHLALLNDADKALYKSITDSISNTYGN